MTEYTGWDNYVKEQQKIDIILGLPFIFASQKDISRLEDKIKDLEEWKRKCECDIDLSNRNSDGSYNQVKVIDKKVWEDIKRYVKDFDILNYDMAHQLPTKAEKYIGYLKDAIKQADPTWCDRD